MKFKENIPRMYLIQFLLFFHFIAPVSVPFFRDWGGLNFTQILFLQSWFMAWAFILEIPTGAIADYFGRKTSIVLACFINGLAALIYASYPNFYIFLIAEFVWAMSTALLSGADTALIYDSLKKMRKSSISKKVFARYGYMISIAIIMASPIGSYIAGFDLRLTMLLTSIPMFAAGIASLTLKEPPYKLKTKEGTRYLQLIKNGVRLIRKDRVLQILSIDFGLAFLIFSFIIWFWQPMVEKGGLNIVYWGLVASGMNLFAVGMSEKVDFIEKIFGTRRFFYFSLLISGILFIVSGFTNYLLILIPIIFLIMGFRVTREPLLKHYLNRFIPSVQRATTLSTITMIGRLFVVIANPLVGMLMDWSLNNTLIIFGILCIIFGLLSRIRLEDIMFRS